MASSWGQCRCGTANMAAEIRVGSREKDFQKEDLKNNNCPRRDDKQFAHVL